MHSRPASKMIRAVCVIAGLIILVAPAIDDVAVITYRFLSPIPFLFVALTIGLYSLAKDGGNYRGSAFVSAGIGSVLMLAAAVLFVSSGPKPVAAVFAIGIPAIIGFGIFTISIAYVLWTTSSILVPRWIPIMLVSAPIVDPLANAFLIYIFPVGISITGGAWIVTGILFSSGERVNKDRTSTTTQPN